MTHPAVYVVTAVVVGVAFVVGFLASRPQATAYGKGGSNRRTSYYPPSPPPSPPPSSARRRERRRTSPGRRRTSPARVSTSASRNSPAHVSTSASPNSPPHVSTSANEHCRTCGNCGQSPFIKISPCNHEICKTCFDNHFKSNGTCPNCHGRIDSCLPSIPSFGKCRGCRRFTELFKFLECNHSLSLCIRCFEEQDISYKACRECNQPIRGSEPRYNTSGICGVCQEFSRFAVFRPCGHRKICRKHASIYLEGSDQECIECGREVTEVA